MRIFRQAQHQWLVRDILHQAQGVFAVYVLHPPQKYTNEEPILWRTALQAAFMVCYLYPRALPPVTHGSALQAPERLRFVFLPRILRIGRIVSCGRTIRSKSLLLPPGLRPCSLMRMLSQLSELPFLIIHIRLVCPQADRKATKQKSCQRQYKMSLHRRLRTITSDL